MTVRQPIQADGPHLSSEGICDLCGDRGGLVAQWTTKPFVHDYNVTGESFPMRYSHPWALCAACDGFVSADDREGLRQHVRETERTKALYEELHSAGIEGALEVTRAHLDQLHDDFWAHKIEGGPLTEFDEPQDELRHEPTERIDVSMVPDVPGMPGREFGISVMSGVNERAVPFCHIYVDGKVYGQLTPNEARSMAMQWLEAAEAAEHDAALVRFLTTASQGVDEPIPMENAVTILGELRKHRGDGNISKQGRPDASPR